MYTEGMGRIETNEYWLVGLRMCDWKQAMVDGIVGHSLESGEINENTNTRILESASC
jgi:hypothetical protein